MAVEKAGLTLTVENYNQFMQQVGSAGEATQQFGQQAQSAAAQISSTFPQAAEAVSKFGQQVLQAGKVTNAGLADIVGQLKLNVSDKLIEELTGLTSRAQNILQTITEWKVPAPELNVAEWNKVAEQMASVYPMGARKAFEADFQQAATTVKAESAEVARASAAAAAEAEKAATAFIAFGAALSVVSAAAADLVLQAVQTAGRIKELGLLLEVTRQNAQDLATEEGNLGKAAALNETAVQAEVQAIRDLHLSGMVANETVAQMIRYNLDWTKASELAREAQDAATFANQDSSQALEGLIKGITTLQPRILRTYGIMVNLTEAYRDYAQANGLVYTELTQEQRQRAALNEVLAQAPRIMGAYEASLESSTKQIRSVRTDLINLAEAYGTSLEPALATTVATFRSFLQGMTELDAPLRGMITGLAAGGATTLTLTAAVTTGVSVFQKMRTAMLGLAGAARTMSAAMLGIGGALTVGLGIYLAITEQVKAQEEAENNLRASILASTDSYADYTNKMREAGLEQGILAENIWETVRAKEAEQRLDFAKQYIEAQEAAEKMVDSLSDIIGGATSLDVALQGLEKIASSDELSQMFAESDQYLQQLMATTGAFEGKSSEAAKEIVDGWTLVAKAFQQTATFAEEQEAVAFVEKLKEEMTLTGKVGVQFAIRLDAVIAALKGLGSATAGSYQDIIEHTEELNEAWARTFTREQLDEKANNIRSFLDDINGALDNANQSMTDAGVRRNRDLQDLDTEYHNKSIDAWIDYQRDLRDSEGDMAAFHAGTLQELLDLDREYLQDRNDAWTKYQQDIEDANRDLARDIEDANRELAQNLSDLDAELAQDRADALRELNEDMEDMAQEHADRLAEIDDERLDSLLDLQEEYGRKRIEIERATLDRMAQLEEDYQEKASDVRLKYARLAYEKSARDMPAHPSREYFIQLFKELELGSVIVPQEYAKLYKQMLAELEGLDQDLFWEQQDLTDDLEQEQKERLEDLEAWLAEEQAAIEAAYAEKTTKENERYAEEQEARRADYEKKLEDLQRAAERERAEIALNNQRKLDDLYRQAEREREAAAIEYARRLEDLAIEYERERVLIGQKLEEQNRDARQKYADALADLTRAKERERDEINLQYNRTIEDANAKLEQMVKEAGEKYNLLPAALQAPYRVIKDDLHGLLFGDGDSLANQWQGFMEYLKQLLQIGSPSRWMMGVGESLIAGLEKGFGDQSISDILTAGFDAAALEANINAALPPNMASLPSGMGASNRNYTRTDNLTVNAQYAHQSEASLRDDLSLYRMMMGAWGR